MNLIQSPHGRKLFLMLHTLWNWFKLCMNATARLNAMLSSESTKTPPHPPSPLALNNVCHTANWLFLPPLVKDLHRSPMARTATPLMTPPWHWVSVTDRPCKVWRINSAHAQITQSLQRIKIEKFRIWPHCNCIEKLKKTWVSEALRKNGLCVGEILKLNLENGY